MSHEIARLTRRDALTLAAGAAGSLALPGAGFAQGVDGFERQRCPCGIVHGLGVGAALAQAQHIGHAQVAGFG